MTCLAETLERAVKRLSGQVLCAALVTAVVFSASAPTTAQNHFNRDKRLRLKRGVGMVTTQGYIGGESQDRYAIRVGAGKELTVTITSEENKADFSVCDAREQDGCQSGEEAPHSRTVKKWAGRVPRDGDYHIFVTAYPGAARYELKITVKR